MLSYPWLKSANEITRWRKKFQKRKFRISCYVFKTIGVLCVKFIEQYVNFDPSNGMENALTPFWAWPFSQRGTCKIRLCSVTLPFYWRGLCEETARNRKITVIAVDTVMQLLLCFLTENRTSRGPESIDDPYMYRGLPPRFWNPHFSLDILYPKS